MRSSHLIAVIAIAASIGGCVKETSADSHKLSDMQDSSITQKNLTILCIEGVQYYKGQSVLAPVVDHNTLSFKPCKV